MTEKKLKSGRKVQIKDLTEDQIADLKDIPEIYFILYFFHYLTLFIFIYYYAAVAIDTTAFVVAALS